MIAGLGCLSIPRVIAAGGRFVTATVGVYNRLPQTMQSSPPIKVGLVSLGCAKNLVDSEVMLGALARDGMELTGNAEDADVVIVNTCGFIEASKQESINAILKANELRVTGRCKALI